MPENQTPSTEVKTEETEIIAPVVESAPEPPVVVEVVPEVKEAAPIVEEVKPVVRPEMDFRLSHKERIIAFMEGKKGTIRLNDFLKSLWPISKPPIPPAITDQANMRKLRVDLLELQKEGKFKLSASINRLGKAHFPDQTTLRTHYYDLTNLIIEAEVN